MRQRAVSLLLPALFFPWILLIAAWKSASQRNRHWLLTFFFTIYGATIAIAYDPLGAGPDGVRHLLNVYVHYVGLSFGQFLSELWLILTFRPADATNDDVFIHVLSYFTGGVLGEPRFFFPIVATIYGYFFSGSMLEVFKYAKSSKRTLFFLAFGLLFFLVMNIEGVNPVRTWTAMWILVYACLKFYSTRRVRYLILMFVPPFVHVGFFVLAIPAWIVLVLGNRQALFAILFAVSSFTTFINPGSVVDVLSETELGADKVRGYYVEEVRDRRDPGQRIWLWLEEFGLQKWALNVFIFALLLSGVYTRRMNRFQKTLFSIGLLTLTMSNSTWYLFAVSNRSWIVGCVFILAAYLCFLQHPNTAPRVPERDPIYRVGLRASLLLFVPYFIYNISVLIDYPSIYLVGLPFLAVLSPESNVSIKEFAQLVLNAVLG
jgi:hypothetical protein